MTNVTELVIKHMNIWSETDPSKRKRMIDEVYAKDCVVFDPFFPEPFTGHEGLVRLIEDVQGKFPGKIFTAVPGSMNEHHNQVRMAWNLGPSMQPSAVTGQDFLLLENGYIKSCTVYLDLPEE
ncbi:nuclear transport factor 2 family protein [Paenibacillus gansuensis]|uniref:Nuclear transport factor 2 family protein n=1 Tax=Paenibacillus gansuensis TaxID=306542 RepID=A0ABW5PAE5_9BACL